MGRSAKELRRSLAPITGIPPSDDAALLRSAVPGQAPLSIREKVKAQSAQLRTGLPPEEVKS